MAINKGDIPFIGNRGGLCGYWRSGVNIVRASSSLTGTRVKKDPVFKGFRKSSSRMKEASPIAAALYNQIPKEKKKYSLYRLLTGEALKMLKEGMDKEAINNKLQKIYIDPILQLPVIHQKPAVKLRSDRKISHKRLFTIYRLGVEYPGRTLFLTESYQSWIKSTLSPPFSGLDVDLVAYG